MGEEGDKRRVKRRGGRDGGEGRWEGRGWGGVMIVFFAVPLLDIPMESLHITTVQR